jgi:hypothetical protein
MRLTVLYAVTALGLAGCAHEPKPAAEAPRAAAAPLPPAPTAPEQPSGDPPEVVHGQGTVADLEALCAERHPECRHAYLQFVGPRHPCAGRGAVCRNEDLAGWRPRWACACEQCATDADCGVGERCTAAEVGCPPTRIARRCEQGAQGEARPGPICIDPPSAAR